MITILLVVLRVKLYPGVGRGDVRHVGVGGEVEAGGAPGQVLQTLQQQVLNLPHYQGLHSWHQE